MDDVSATETFTDTGSDTETTIDPSLGDGDHDRFAHYVKKVSILESALEGNEVEALCGKRWIPTRDPKKYPVCPTCKSIFESLSSA